MKLYLLSQTENNGYGTYDSAVVAAESEHLAKQIHPGNPKKLNDLRDTWPISLEHISCEYLGEAVEGTKKGVICASYNAG